MHFRHLAIVAMALLMTAPAFAADWVVMRLRGVVQVRVDDAWVPLKRGDVVDNAQMVRTLATGHVELQRNLEVVTLGANTQLQITTDSETGYTTVLQDSGRVEVDAEAKKVKHFEVRNAYLAAVVKGTHFSVTADPDGASVLVDRGAVQVQSISTERVTTVGVGQTATVRLKTDMAVGGLGPWPVIVDPGVRRAKIVAAIGSGLSVPSSSTGSIKKAGTPLPAPAPSGGVQLVAASTSPLFGLGAASQRPASTDAATGQPVSFGIVLVGAILGAALGGLGLLLRRAV